MQVSKFCKYFGEVQASIEEKKVKACQKIMTDTSKTFFFTYKGIMNYFEIHVFFSLQ